jgi:hypothetical protein
MLKRGEVGFDLNLLSSNKNLSCGNVDIGKIGHLRMGPFYDPAMLYFFNKA